MRPAQAALVLALALVAGASLIPTAAGQPQPAVYVDDQRTSGTIVIADYAQLPDGGFVVLHEPGPEGELGPVVGTSSILSAGMHRTVPVVLFDEVEDETRLIATLYEDTNANGELDVDGDGHDGHDHQHDDRVSDRAYTDGDLPVGDTAEIQPYGQTGQAPDTVNPLLVGTATAIAALALWAVRYR